MEGKPFIISYGSEDYFLDQDLNKARSWNGRVVRVLPELTESMFIQACQTPDLEGRAIVVVIDDAQDLSGKLVEEYIENVMGDSVVAVAICRSQTLPKLWKKAAKKGKLRQYKKLKTYDTNNEVVKWAQKRAVGLGFTLDQKMGLLLFQLVGDDLYRLDNELRKFQILLASEGAKEVTVEHVKSVVAPVNTYLPFHVAEEAFGGDKYKALLIISKLIEAQGDDVLMPIFVGLTKKAEKFMLARALHDEGKSPKDIASFLDLNAWWAERFFLPKVYKYRMGVLVRILKRLARLDGLLRSSVLPKRTLVELAVVEIASR